MGGGKLQPTGKRIAADHARAKRTFVHGLDSPTAADETQTRRTALSTEICAICRSVKPDAAQHRQKIGQQPGQPRPAAVASPIRLPRHVHADKQLMRKLVASCDDQVDGDATLAAAQLAKMLVVLQAHAQTDSNSR